MRNIIVYTRDFSGCSHVRLRWPCNHIIANADRYGLNIIFSNDPIFDPGILANTQAIICQRFVTSVDKDFITQYKVLQPKYGYKLVFELDDICFGNYVPDYNASSLYRSEKMINEMDTILSNTLKFYDNIVVSTDFLKKMISERYNVWNVTVQPNLVPKSLWGVQHKKPVRKKPLILYSGAQQHYLNPSILQNGQRIIQKQGDWTDAWIEFICEGVKNNVFDFACMGGLPYFFEPIKDRIQSIPWVSCDAFPNQVKSLDADISIAPLCNNVFNCCKSDLRYIEACANGMLFMGTVFADGPYREVTHGMIRPEATVQEIREKYEYLLSNRDVVLKDEKQFIMQNRRYVENGINNYMNSYLMRE